MIKFINSVTGTEMLVADDRREEYLAAGHKLAAVPSVKKAESVKEETREKTIPKKTPVKKATTRKK